MAGPGGREKKRLSLACELVGRSPAVVCADEPTSGLDSFQAQKVMESLRSLAHDEVRAAPRACLSVCLYSKAD